MTRYPSPGDFEELEPELIFEGHRRLKGYQAIGLYEAMALFGWRGDPDYMPFDARDQLIVLLKFLGYHETWARRKRGNQFGLMWLRKPWPSDAEALKGRIIRRIVRRG